MPSDAAQAHAAPHEVELKLALCGADSAGLAQALAKSPLLARRKASRQQLHNLYFDSPNQALRQARAALRLRQVQADGRLQWRQTLKMGGNPDSALARRGEWETVVAGPALDAKALRGTPWQELDPEGTLLGQLQPQFSTRFERTRWLVRGADRSQVEVALDLGHIAAGDSQWPVCELELELLAGPPEALFRVAAQLAQVVAVVPAAASKSERGYALAQHARQQPRRAGPPVLGPGLAREQAAQLSLREMFMQFCENLAALRGADDVEFVHQARVGWRRFKSALKLFEPALAGVPSWQPLRPLLVFLGDLRDLDVARTETLPQFARAYANGDARRGERWQAMAQAMEQAAALKRKSVRYALQEPAVGGCLLALCQWLEQAPAAAAPTLEARHGLRHWVRRRVARQERKLQAALKAAGAGAAGPQRHRARILAKRLRYCVEAVRPLLPKKEAKLLLKHATQVQTRIGQQRDLVQACALLSELDLDPGLAEFLRGVAAGREAPG
jgi:inorganic triphosphatase YgiF